MLAISLDEREEAIAGFCTKGEGILISVLKGSLSVTLRVDDGWQMSKETYHKATERDKRAADLMIAVEVVKSSQMLAILGDRPNRIA